MFHMFHNLLVARNLRWLWKPLMRPTGYNVSNERRLNAIIVGSLWVTRAEKFAEEGAERLQRFWF